MHDACAVAWVIDPSLITAVPMHIDIELHGALTRGMTVCDYRHLRGTVPAAGLLNARRRWATAAKSRMRKPRWNSTSPDSSTY